MCYLCQSYNIFLYTISQKYFDHSTVVSIIENELFQEASPFDETQTELKVSYASIYIH